MKQKLILFLLGIGISVSGYTQQTWSLKDCIDHAKKNNLNLKQSEIAIRQAELSKTAAQYARLPSVNGNIAGGFNFGRTIDPTINGFRNQRVGYNSFGIQSSIVVYNGGRINNTIKQSQLNIAATKAEAADYFQNLSLDIIAAYFDILLTKEQVSIGEQQIQQTKEQLLYIDRQIKAGMLPENDRLEIIAQIARNNQTLVNAQNALALNYLRLKNYLELTPDYPLKVQLPKSAPNIVISASKLSLPQVYTQVLNTQPAVKAAAIRMESAALGISLAKANALPSVVLSASLNSSYANVSDFSDTPFFNQIDNNLGQSIALRVAIPIYNNQNTKIGIERARLEIINAEVQQKQVEQQLKANIQNAIANAKGTHIALVATQSALEAAKSSFQNAQKKHQLGAINTLEYTTTKTNLDTAEMEVVRAKYDYLFRLKIIDLYMGKD